MSLEKETAKRAAVDLEFIQTYPVSLISDIQRCGACAPQARHSRFFGALRRFFARSRQGQRN